MQHYISFVGKQTLQLAITTASLKRARHPRSYISFSLPSLVSSAVSKTPITCCVGYMHRKICWRVQGFGRTRLRQEVSGAISLRETPEECTVKQIQRYQNPFLCFSHIPRRYQGAMSRVNPCKQRILLSLGNCVF